MAEFPFQRRLGAFPLRAGRTEFRVWAPNPHEIAAPHGRHRSRARAVRRRHLRAHRRRRGHATTTLSCSTARAARPVLALAAGGPARPVPDRRPAEFAWTDGDFRAPGLHDCVSTSSTSGRSPPRGPSGRDRVSGAEPAALGVTAVELMPVADFRARAAGATTASIRTRPNPPTAGRSGCRSSSTRPTGIGLAVILDVVHNHVGATGSGALLAFGPYFTDKHHHTVGRRAQRGRRAVRRRARVGLPER